METGTKPPNVARALARTGRLLRVVVVGAAALASACASQAKRGEGAAGDPGRTTSSDGGKDAGGVRGW